MGKSNKTEISVNRVSINPLQPGVAFLYPLKTSETFRFSDVFKGYGKATSTCNRLIKFNRSTVKKENHTLLTENLMFRV